MTFVNPIASGFLVGCRLLPLRHQVFLTINLEWDVVKTMKTIQMYMSIPPAANSRNVLNVDLMLLAPCAKTTKTYTTTETTPPAANLGHARDARVLAEGGMQIWQNPHKYGSTVFLLNPDKLSGAAVKTMRNSLSRSKHGKHQHLPCGCTKADSKSCRFSPCSSIRLSFTFIELWTKMKNGWRRIPISP